MANSKLNYDVLLNIMDMQVSERKSHVVPMMHTCRTLYKCGIPLLFSGGVIIRSVHRLSSFYRFMSADKTRLRHLRRLTLKLNIPEELDERIDHTLVVIFRHSNNLTALYMYDADRLNECPRASKALSRMKTLDKLALYSASCGPKGNLQKIMSNFQSKLRLLIVSFYNGFPEDNVDNIADPIVVFEGIAPHVKLLHVKNAGFRSLHGVQFPQLRFLFCGDYTVLMDSCAPLIQAFPNLQALNISKCCHLSDSAVEGRRTANIKVQQDLRWQRLAYLSGEVSSLYGIALQCPVTTLNVEMPYHELEVAMLQLGAVLRDSTPQNLTLSVPSDFVFSALESAFRETSIRCRLSHSAFEFRMPALGDGSEAQTVFDSVFAAVKPLNLTYFRLNLHYNGPGLRYVESEADRDIDKLDHIADSLRRLDPATCAHKLMNGMQSLRTIILEWNFGAPSHLFVATIEEKDGVRSASFLDAEAARTLRQGTEDSWFLDLPGNDRALYVVDNS